MQKYLKLTKHLIQEFEEVKFEQVPRSQNTAADEISKLASSEDGQMDGWTRIWQWKSRNTPASKKSQHSLSRTRAAG